MTDGYADTGSGQAGTYERILYGYVTFPSDIDLSGPYPGVGSLGGRMPVDSLPWDALTHVSFFAADVNSDGSWNNSGNGPGYLYKMPYLAEQAHLRGVYSGFCFGGSGDAGLRAALWDTSAHDNLIALCLDLIDNKGQDFVDFDIEGRPFYEDLWTVFAARLYDSLQTRRSHNNPSHPPFIVLTVGVTRALNEAIISEPYVEIINIMSYDNAGSWWGQLTYDCSITSWSNLDGTGTNVDPQNYAGQGGKAFPSLQEGARLLMEGGWPREKIVMGADFNPTTVTGGTFSDGRGPTEIRKVWSSPPSWSGSGLKFYREWHGTHALANVPEDRIIFDPASGTYWAHTGTDLATDKMYLQVSWPGKDSSIYYIRQMVDAMDIGGTMIWGLTETYGTSTPAPPGGWAWLGNQYEKYFGKTGMVDVVDSVPPAVGFTAPASGDTVSGEVVFTVDASDNIGLRGVRFMVDGAWAGPEDTRYPYAYSWSSPSVPDGYHVVSAVATDGAGLADTASIEIFVLNDLPAADPTAPLLVSPSDGSVLQSGSLSLVWSAVGGSDSYRLQVAQDSSMTAFVVNDSTVGDTTFQFAELGQGLYYWRVSAVTSGSETAFSATRRFSVEAGMTVVKYDRLFIDFGMVEVGDFKTDSISLFNEGEQDVSILDVKSTSPDFDVVVDRRSVSSHSVAKLYLTYKPQKRGNNSELVITTLDTLLRSDTIKVTGRGGNAPKGRWNKSSIVFGEIPVETEAVDSFYLANDGDFDLVVEEAAVTNTLFHVTPTSTTIPGGDSTMFRISATPETAGDQAGYLILNTNGKPGVDSVYISFSAVENNPIGTSIPGQYSIAQNYPNPFNPSTTIEYSLPVNSFVRIEVYSILGSRISTLYNGIQEPGTWSVTWDGLSERGESLSGGVYILRISAEGSGADGERFSDIVKMFLLK